ncbi:hypothetical protein EDB87DRAFT_678540 [Lactarius vividus]|nr:hypothetical protein EDB87DRAFT_678540 [Lactarius vividus]
MTKRTRLIKQRYNRNLSDARAHRQWVTNLRKRKGRSRACQPPEDRGVEDTAMSPRSHNKKARHRCESEHQLNTVYPMEEEAQIVSQNMINIGASSFYGKFGNDQEGSLRESMNNNCKSEIMPVYGRKLVTAVTIIRRSRGATSITSRLRLALLSPSIEQAHLGLLNSRSFSALPLIAKTLSTNVTDRSVEKYQAFTLLNSVW